MSVRAIVFFLHFICLTERRPETFHGDQVLVFFYISFVIKLLTIGTK